MLLQQVVIRQFCVVGVQLFFRETKPLWRRHLGFGTSHVDKLFGFLKLIHTKILAASVPANKRLKTKTEQQNKLRVITLDRSAFDSCDALISGPTSVRSFLNISDTGDDVEMVLRAALFPSAFNYEATKGENQPG
jgi:hypothetical protein